jgi:hypothetical protein
MAGPHLRANAGSGDSRIRGCETPFPPRTGEGGPRAEGAGWVGFLDAASSLKPGAAP